MSEHRESFTNFNNTNYYTYLYDVIIIGAGLAGLSAGHYLSKGYIGLSILVIEAKDRVGGRIQTVELNCSKEGEKRKWDVGGQWVNDSQTYIKGLLNEMNIETYKQYDKGTSILEANGQAYTFDGHKPYVKLGSTMETGWLLSKIDLALRKVNVMEPFLNLEYAKKLDALNMKQAFYSHAISGVSKSVLDTAIRSIYGLEAQELNALFAIILNKSCGESIETLTHSGPNCAQEKKIKGGAKQICFTLLSNILSKNSNSRAIFNRPVIRIEQQKDTNFVYVLSQVTNKIETYLCKKIVMAVPLNQYSSIKFNPELPPVKRNYLASCKIGNLIKFIVTYNECFWRYKGLSGFVLSDGTVEHSKCNNFIKLRPVAVTYDATTYDGYPAIVGFIPGDVAVYWAQQHPEFRKKMIIEDLISFFGQEAASYIDYYEKDWNMEPFVGGCPTCCVTSPGVMKDSAKALREPFLNMHFCGTETAIQWQGYMDGAVESGVRVANEILYISYRNIPEARIDYSKTYYHQDTETKELIKKQGEKYSKVKTIIKNSVFVGMGSIAAHKLQKKFTKQLSS